MPSWLTDADAKLSSSRNSVAEPSGTKATNGTKLSSEPGVPDGPDAPSSPAVAETLQSLQLEIEREGEDRLVASPGHAPEPRWLSDAWAETHSGPAPQKTYSAEHPPQHVDTSNLTDGMGKLLREQAEAAEAAGLVPVCNRNDDGTLTVYYVPPSDPEPPVPEQPPTAGEHFLNAVTGRSYLAQPADLLSSTGGQGSAWHAAFLGAMTELEGSAADAPLRAQRALTKCLALAKREDAPRGALVSTLRGMGCTFVTMGALLKGDSVYNKALKDATHDIKGPADVPGLKVAFGCWRDLSVLRRLQLDPQDAARCIESAMEVLVRAQVAERCAQQLVGSQEDAAQALAQANEQDESARMELRLGLSDCYCTLGRFRDAECLVGPVLSWRRDVRGSKDPSTLAAIYALSRVKRRTGFSTIPSADEEAEPGKYCIEPAAAAEATKPAEPAEPAEKLVEAGEARGDGRPEPGERDEPVVGAEWDEPVASVAIATVTAKTASLDEEWLDGLRSASDGKADWIEYVIALASALASLHKEWAEALHLIELARPHYKEVHCGKGVEWAELEIAAGEYSMELRLFSRSTAHFRAARRVLADLAARPIDAAAAEPEPGAPEGISTEPAATEPFREGRAPDATDPRVLLGSIASVECHEACLLGQTGHPDAADELFSRAMVQLSKSSESLVASASESADALRTTGQGSLLAVQVMRARALRLEAKHHDRRGRAERAAEDRAEAMRLDAMYGFSSYSEANSVA